MNTQQKITRFLLAKENIYIILLFLCFSALRTQVANLIYFLFDQAFLDGLVSDIYVYNYHGDLLGCEQIVKLNEGSSNHNWFQRYGLTYTQYLPSLIAFFILLKNKYRGRFTFWLLVVISCFSILECIIRIQYLFMGRISGDFFGLMIIFLQCMLFIGIGFYILFKIMNAEQRLRVVFIAFPFFVLGFFLWYRWIGPSILPIVA